VTATDEISPGEVESKRQEDGAIDLIDVRTAVEFEAVHAVPARNVPLDQLDAASLLSQRGGNGSPLYLICKSGSRARQARQKFAAAGCESVVCVAGGTDAWVAAGLPVVRGRQAISLERQVRIAAGSLVLLGTLLAWQVNFAFIAISAFVGAGLVFAGVTDTCGMGMMLAKMPWNRRKG